MNNEFPIFFIFGVEFCIFSGNFWWKFVRISRQIPEKSDVCRFFNKIAEIISEICENYSILLSNPYLPWTVLSEYDYLWRRNPNKQVFLLSEYDMTSDREANKHEKRFKRIRLGYEAENQ